MIGEWVHNLTHGHWAVQKHGIGEMFMCYWRWPFNGRGKIWFHPELTGAGWHQLPRDPAFIRELGGASSALEAMSIVRAQDGS